MIVISDTTPIISLLKINRLSLLQDLFGEVKIPLAVFNELTVNLKFAEENRGCEKFFVHKNFRSKG